MTPQQLKNAILQQAIQGKLVEQRAEEGTGKELYKVIQDEKQKLIQEGKLKKQKALPEITEDEIPFEIPETWKWAKCGDILNIVSSKRVHQSDWQNKGIPFYRAREISKLSEFGMVDNDLFISEELFNNLSIYGLPEKNDLMVSAVGTLGKTYIVKEKDRFYYKDASVLCFKNFAQINAKFLKYAMESSLMKNQIDSNSRGTTVGTLTIVRMSNYIIPLPPLAEQKRIVEKIEELLPLVERYEKAWTRLEELNKKFPLDMQKAILGQAIQGKLVEQRAEEGTGQELYKAIQSEKQKLIQEVKLKKQKNLPEITEEEIPFEIPETWKWVKLGEIGDWGSGATPSRTNPEYYGGDIPWLKTGDLTDGYIYDVPEYITGLALERTSVRLNPKGSILIAMYGATIGKLGILTKAMTTNQACCACIVFPSIYNLYLFYFLLANRTTFIKKGEGGAQPNISKEKIVNTLIPLPPLSEQKRIVEKIEELLPLVEKLK